MMAVRAAFGAFVALLVLLAAYSPAMAVQPDEVLKDAKLEARARALSAELRCLVCQNQSIDDSDAPLARDLRILVRERLNAGDTDAQVMDFVVSRYGEFVLLRPRFNAHTLILWLLPPIVLILASVILVRIYRSRSGIAAAGGAADSLSDAEQARLKEILDGD